GRGRDPAGTSVDRARVLCVGDGVITDVKGAHDQGLDCLFIAKGIHGEAAVGRRRGAESRSRRPFSGAESVGATHAMGDLVLVRLGPG
ncbi:hypothetical protein CSW58_09895, partial [Caulobacter sp. B11]